MSLRDQIEQLSPREQKLLLLLGAVFGLLLFVGLPVYLYTNVLSADEENEDIRKLLTEMNRSAVLLAERKRDRDALMRRYDRKAPSLASFVEKAAKAHGIVLPESKDRPEVPHGDNYRERITVVRMRKVGMLELVKTLERIERSGFPVAVSRLQIKKRAGGADLWDVELGVSAFDRIGPSKSEADGKPAASAKASSSAPARGQPL